MVKLMDSIQRQPGSPDLVRWHLLDDNYNLIKPVESFLRYKLLGGSSPGTCKVYAQKLFVFWKYLELKQLDWRDFTKLHMAEFGHWYLTGGVLLNEKARHQDLDEIPPKLDESTVNLALTVVTLFYDFCTDNGTTEDKRLRDYRRLYRSQSGRSPVVGLNNVRYKESRKYPGTLTSEQIRILIDACRTARDKLIIWLLADSGMRIGELLGLHLSDVNWSTRKLKIVRRQNPNHAYAKGQERELSINGLMQDGEFCELVSEYLDVEYPIEVGKRLGHSMMFVVLHRGAPSYGKPLSPQNINKLLKRLKQKTQIDLERLYPHLFRHTFATHNIRQGRSKGKGKEEIGKSVQRQLGHKRYETTVNTYDHSFNEATLLEEFERIVKPK